MIAHLIAYLTNHLGSHVPCFALRRWWYPTTVGLRIGRRAPELRYELTFRPWLE